MIRQMVSFGDSFIYGSDLADCGPQASLLTWPAIVAQDLGIDYWCRALGGCGNTVILTQILDTIHKLGNTCLYVINWTWIDRFDYTEPVQGLWHTVRPSLDHDKIDAFYYRNLHHDLGDKMRSCSAVDLAVKSLQHNDCNFVMTYMDTALLDQQHRPMNYIDYLQQQIRPHLETFQGQTFLEWSKTQGFAISDRWHPLEQAHKRAAELWLPHYEKLLGYSGKYGKGD